MKPIFISHTSALNFYRNARINHNINLINYNPVSNSLKLIPVNTKLSSTECLNYNKIKSLELPYCGNDPIHILTSNINQDYRNHNLTIHYSKYPLLNNAVIKFSKDVYFPSPELLFCQMSQIVPIEQLMQLALELCGTYSLSNFSPIGFIQNLPPLTTQEKLYRFTKCLYAQNKNYKKIKNALYVSSWVANNSASPMESNLYIKLCAARKYGGYNVANIVLNKRIKLSNNATEILKFDYITPDLCNTKTKIAIEYDSKEFHSNLEQFEKDKIRITALQYDNWIIFTFVSKQMNDVYAFHNIAQKILQANGQEYRIRSNTFEQKRRKLWLGL